MSKSVLLSEQALNRLPRYLSFLKELQREQTEYVTAPTVAKYLGLNEVQVRKELSFMSTVPGRPRTGFRVSSLIENMEIYLGYRNVDDAVLVGAGSLGCALLMGNENFVMSWSLFISTESEPSVRFVDTVMASLIVSVLPSASSRA